MGVYLMTMKDRRKNSPYGDQPFDSAQTTSYTELNIHESFKLNGQCSVCHLKGYVYVLSPDNFIAKHYKLKEKENEVCSECWVKAKVHDPEKEKFRMQFDYDTGLLSGQKRHLKE